MRGAKGVYAILAAFVAFASVGCDHLPGKPGFRPETQTPHQTHNFAILYKTNCSACHGEQGRNGASFSLNNPVYLAWAGRDTLRNIVANGVPHRLMPAFGPSGGGLLTDKQVDEIVDGMMGHWGQPKVLGDQAPPAYAAAMGDAAAGKAVFQTYCARCHGADGKGLPTGGDAVNGSIVDPSYLALISSRGLRDIVVAGMPDEKMPDWRGDVPGKPMTDSEVGDVVAWLVSHRTSYPGTLISPAQKRQKMATHAPAKQSGSRR
jgi:cytochrome c oxidase cbb3-type subunit 3/ubiquinol-cytochrome c reductase cytochrome c subunit